MLQLLSGQYFLIEKDLSPSVLRRLKRLSTNQMHEEYTAKDKINLVMQDTGYKNSNLGDFLRNYKFTDTIKIN